MSIVSRVARFGAITALATCAFAATANAAAPTFTSNNGITVTAQSQIDDRLVDLKVSTAAVSPKATAKGNGIRVLLPEGYDPSGSTRYPVIYLQHGFSFYYTAFTDGGGRAALESIIGDRKVIIVMPDGGRGGWYTDWIDQSIAQKWETYHLKQLIPFIDANLSTIANRDGRAIGGYSMGGLGAVRYAEDRPDLFGTVVSMSGALNLRDPAITAAVLGSAVYGLNGAGSYGLPFWPFDAKWHTATPFANPTALKNTNVFLGAAQSSPTVPMTSGNALMDGATQIAESVVRNASSDFHKLLDAKGVANSYTNYGAPGAFQYGYCDGGHGAPCALYQLQDLLPKVIAKLTPAS